MSRIRSTVGGNNHKALAQDVLREQSEAKIAYAEEFQIIEELGHRLRNTSHADALFKMVVLHSKGNQHLMNAINLTQEMIRLILASRESPNADSAELQQQVEELRQQVQGIQQLLDFQRLMAD